MESPWLVASIVFTTLATGCSDPERESGGEVDPRCDPAFAAHPQVNPPASNDPALNDIPGSRKRLDKEYAQVEAAPSARKGTVWMLIDKAGKVQEVKLHRSSGVVAVDSAAMRALSTFSFKPAHYGDEVLCFWLNVPFPPPERGR